MRKLLLALSLLLITSPAHATKYYFDNGTGTTTGCDNINTPCDNFPATTLDNLNALACGDQVLFKRGDEWTGSEADVQIRRTGCTVSTPIIVGAYGTGADPILAGAAVTSSGWSGNLGNNTYSLSGQSQTLIGAVTQQDTKALGGWNGSTSALPEGTYARSGSTLYVHLWGNLNPATSSVRVASYFAAAIGRGLLRTSDTASEAHYVHFRDIHMVGVNGVSLSIGGNGNRTANITYTGGAKDQWLAYYNSSFGGLAQDWGDYYSEGRYGSEMAQYWQAGSDGVAGQPFTAYGGPYGFLVGTWVHHGFMAGIDMLDFGSTSNVTQVYLLRTKTEYNGLAQINPSYDPNIYIDGSSEVFLYGNIIGPGGVGTGTAGNTRGGLQLGTEHPTTKIPENITVVNNLISGINYQGSDFSEICFSVTECPPDGSTKPNNINNITYSYNTILANNSNGYVAYMPNTRSTADNIKWTNNIMYGDNGAPIAETFTSTQTTVAKAAWDFNENQYYRRGGNTDIFKLSGTTCGGGGDTNCTLSEWRTETSEDALSAYGDPLFVTDSDTAPDVHLSSGSPARDTGMTSAYTIPSWLPQTVKDDITQYGIKGSTQSTYTEDDVATNPDRGFHYDYAGLTSTTVTMSSNAQNTVGTATVTFTCPKGVTALIMDDKVKVTFPSGFVLNSGGTSAATASTGISGTFTACTVSGQTITCPRTGDGDSEFPEVYTSHSLTISNIKTPNVTGTTGTFTVEVLGNIWGTADTRRAWNYSVPGITISTSGGATCGNSIIEAGESCDDGNTTALDGCSATCQTETPTCGNSIVEYLEQCDDGNATALDGCSDTCQIETPVCGNGVIESGETCDDGNTTASDGCDASCLTESSSTGHQINIGNLSCSKLIQH